MNVGGDAGRLAGRNVVGMCGVGCGRDCGRSEVEEQLAGVVTAFERCLAGVGAHG